MKNYKTNTDQYEVKDENGKILFECFLWEDLLEGMPQIHIETPYAVYNGPIEGVLNDKLV